VIARRGRVTTHGPQTNCALHVSGAVQPSSLLGSQARHRSTPEPMSTHSPCTPSVQSVSSPQAASAPQAPFEPQSGPAAPPSAPHSASEAHALQAVEPQMGFVEASSQPPLSTQSTQVAVAGSH
jgi:hypothetical protein